MRSLLDINVLIALMDPDHAFHARAHEWWRQEARPWASCPLTENGLVRIMASTAYSKNTHFTVQDVASRFGIFATTSDHTFWPDSLTLGDESIFHHPSILSSKYLTNLYLLGLAAANDGCLVTFDQHIPITAVTIANSSHLKVI